MAYVIFNGTKNKQTLDRFSPFKTQSGQKAMRLIGNIIGNDKGFKLYSNSDVILGDFSDYKSVYQQTEDSIEYCEEEEEIIFPTLGEAEIPTSAISNLSTRISQLDNKVSAIEPYVMEKQAYIGDTECVFDKAKDGAITVMLNDNSCNYRVEGNKVIAEFEALEEVATVRVVIGGV